MKKIIFAIAIVLTIGLTAGAQGGIDGFFGTSSNDIYGNRTTTPGFSSDPIVLPGGDFGLTQDQPLPLGSGLLILTALGAGYAVARKKK